MTINYGELATKLLVFEQESALITEQEAALTDADATVLQHTEAVSAIRNQLVQAEGDLQTAVEKRDAVKTALHAELARLNATQVEVFGVMGQAVDKFRAGSGLIGQATVPVAAGSPTVSAIEAEESQVAHAEDKGVVQPTTEATVEHAAPKALSPDVSAAPALAFSNVPAGVLVDPSAFEPEVIHQVRETGDLHTATLLKIIAAPLHQVEKAPVELETTPGATPAAPNAPKQEGILLSIFKKLGRASDKGASMTQAPAAIQPTPGLNKATAPLAPTGAPLKKVVGGNDPVFSIE